MIETFPTVNFSAYQRQTILEKLSTLLDMHKAELADLIVSEVKKPISLAQREVERAVAITKDAAAEAVRFGGEWLPADIQASTAQHQIFSKRVPLGPLLAITPFNYPLNLAVHKIAPAMAVGLAFVLKPSPRAPRTAQLLIQLIHDAGWPQAAAQLLTCPNEQVIDWVRDPRFAIVSFTGSAAIGWKIKKEAAAKQVLLELGGNASVVLAPDAAWNKAIARIVWGAFMYAGQVCISVQQIWIHDLFYEACCKAIVSETEKLKVGDPQQAAILVPPMIDGAAAARIEVWIKTAQAGGAKILCGGNRDDATFSPTVLSEVPLSSLLVCEEAFGPILVVHRYHDLSEVYQHLQADAYGLQTAVYTESLRTAFDAYQKISAGTVLINEIPTFRLDTMPYGGTKASGVGREGVRHAMLDYSEAKNLVLQPYFSGLA